ncbi:MAG: zinc-ribbon domain-containing protein [Elusimicrobia bacterium]|nr:zinc-ribbon domain-containing protein [Elusimicrobiota bacterium]
MDISCGSCSARLVLPDAQIPRDVEAFKVRCPKCQGMIRVEVGKPAAGPPAPEAPPPPAEPPPQQQQQAPPPAPAAEPEPLEEDEFVEGRRLAMVCIDQPALRADAQTALEAIGLTVHAPAQGADAVRRLKRNKYEILVIHEEYGGSREKNVVLQAIQPMAMSHRRHICVGLVGKSLRTLDHMAAFANSVNFAVAEREVAKLQAIAKQAMVENDQFYLGFREALRETGRM